MKAGQIWTDFSFKNFFAIQFFMKIYNLQEAAVSGINDRGHKSPLGDWAERFDKRYGAGSYEKLLGLLDIPCTNYQHIAKEFGVTREAARLWHDEIYPGQAKTGRERQHTCFVENNKKKVFDDKLFRIFYRSARKHFLRENIALIPQPTKGFRSRTVKLCDNKVSLHRAAMRRNRDTMYGAKTYIIHRPKGVFDYIFYSLGTTTDFLFVPKDKIGRASCRERVCQYV